MWQGSVNTPSSESMWVVDGALPDFLLCYVLSPYASVSNEESLFGCESVDRLQRFLTFFLCLLLCVYECSVSRSDEDIITIKIRGNGFLYNMVRIIAGTLIEVGGGKLSPEDISVILEKKDRDAAGPTAPAKGLTLVEVRY